MKSKLTIQQMINDLGDHGVSVADITASLETNQGSVLEDPFWEINNDLCEGILRSRWEALTDLEKFERLFEIIQLWPCYSTASFLPRLFNAGVNSEAEAFLWHGILMILEEGEQLQREAIEYVLWVDFFEDPSMCTKAWSGTMNADLNSVVKARLLVNSGPIPYAQKRCYYHDLLKDQKDHELLAECLARCLNDVYGDIDHNDAQAMVRQMQVDPDNEFMTYLRNNL